MRITFSRVPLVLALTTIGVVFGCAQIIGADGDRGLTPLAVEPNPPVNFVDAGDAVAPVPDAAVPAEECRPTQKKCNGGCVSKSDPLYGCGSKNCTPCSVENAKVMACIDGECGAGSCKFGFAFCGAPTAGCTVDLTTPSDCGMCNHQCNGLMPYCSPNSTCTSDCDPMLTQCGLSCIDTTTSPYHCGAVGDPTACTNKCPTPDNGDATCTGGKCGVACRTGFDHCVDQATCVPLTVFYRDADNDGWGDVTQSKLACSATAAGAGWVPMAGDCNDNQPSVFPGQTKYFGASYKRADGSSSYDYNCDGVEAETPGVPHYTPCDSACKGAGVSPAGSGRAGAGVNDYCGSTQTLTCQTMTVIAQADPRLHFSNVTPLTSSGGPMMLPADCGTVAAVIAPNPCR